MDVVTCVFAPYMTASRVAVWLRLPESLVRPPTSLDTQTALFSETVTFDRQALTTFLAQHVSTSSNYVRRLQAYTFLHSAPVLAPTANAGHAACSE